MGKALQSNADVIPVLVTGIDCSAGIKRSDLGHDSPLGIGKHARLTLVGRWVPVTSTGMTLLLEA